MVAFIQSNPLLTRMHTLLVQAEQCAHDSNRPKRMLEQIKGISEAKAAKLLAEGIRCWNILIY